MTKKCCKCKRELSEECFSKRHGKLEGQLYSRCKECRSYRNSEKWKNDVNFRKQRLSQNFQYRYGITKADFLNCLKNQNYKCIVCGRELDVTTVKKINSSNQDHDHRTNKLRGILCGNCNKLAGFAKDDIVILGKMIRYLREFNKT